MSEFQIRCWKKMSQLIEDYQHGKITFHALVCGLEDSLDRTNLKDRGLISKWYEYFNPLEEADSDAWYEMEDLDYEKINPWLRKMKDFLLEQIQSLAVPTSHQAAHPKLAHSKN